MMRLFAALFILISVALPAAAKAGSGFTLLFEFRPPYVQNNGTAAAFFLDDCGDQYCSTVAASMPMNCDVTGGAMAPGATSYVTEVTRCHVNWKMKHGRKAQQQPASWLVNPGYLRVRSNDQTSQPFYFAGQPPGADEINYRYQIMQEGPGGPFQVAPLK